jgi:hypothetical protein
MRIGIHHVNESASSYAISKEQAACCEAVSGEIAKPNQSIGGRKGGSVKPNLLAVRCSFFKVSNSGCIVL